MTHAMEEKNNKNNKNTFEDISKVLDVYWCSNTEKYVIKYENKEHSRDDFCFN